MMTTWSKVRRATLFKILAVSVLLLLGTTLGYYMIFHLEEGTEVPNDVPAAIPVVIPLPGGLEELEPVEHKPTVDLDTKEPAPEQEQEEVEEQEQGEEKEEEKSAAST